MAVRAFTAVVYKEDEVYVADCPEVGTSSYGNTIEEAIANLKEATELYLEVAPQPEIKRSFVTTFEADYAA
jgi:predicted RNase H-like HicB family nuclease